MNFHEFIKIFNGSKLDGEKIILKSGLHDAIELIFKNYHYDMLKEIIAVDCGDGVTELTYRLYSSEDDEDALISINVNNEAESITDIFASAIADEREIFDLFGVNFVGHDDLKRLYMPEDWKGYPLKKDYVQDDSRLAWNDNNNV